LNAKQQIHHILTVDLGRPLDFFCSFQYDNLLKKDFIKKMLQKEKLAPFRRATGMMEGWNAGIMNLGRLKYKYIYTVTVVKI